MPTLSVGRLLLAVLVLAAAGAGCDTPPRVVERDPNLPVGNPIEAPANTWSWIDFPDSTCDEGTPTGLMANLSSTSKDLVIFFNGGGACWNGVTCLALNSSTHGPITQASFNAGTFGNGSILDRQLAQNPVANWNLFFIPYCTGDLHFGNNDAVYTFNSTTKTIHHKGRKNVEAFLARIAATLDKPERVLVTGSSAGGYGATLNYDLIHAYFPASKVFLVDDSGPLLKGSAISQSLRDAWATAWQYGPLLEGIDPAAKTDFSTVYTALATKYPTERMALLSYSQDQVIRTYIQISAAQFEAALNDLDTTVLEPLPRFRYFVIAGSSHTMLGNPATQTSAGVGLLGWLGQMQTAPDSEWKSAHP